MYPLVGAFAPILVCCWRISGSKIRHWFFPYQNKGRSLPKNLKMIKLLSINCLHHTGSHLGKAITLQSDN